jgi:hypothetical protein
MNAELYKNENSVRKAESAWDRQMQRDGHLKRESRDISCADPQFMTPTARAFYYEYVAARDALDAVATSVDLFGGSPARPKDFSQKPSPEKPALTNPDAVVTPPDMARHIVAPTVLAEWKASSAVESLSKPKPSAKLVRLDELTYVVTGVSEDYVILTRCLFEDEWDGDVIETVAAADDPSNLVGLKFKTGTGKNAINYVMCNSAQSVACIAGDPLAHVQLDEGTG